MTRNDVDLGLWTEFLVTWYTSTFDGGHVWVVYRCRYSDVPARYAVERGSPAAAREGVNLAPPSRQSLPEELAAIALLDAAKIEALLEEAKSLSIPVVGTRPIGIQLDGWRRGFVHEGVRLTWNGSRPEAWAPFADWVVRLQDLLHEALTKDREPTTLER